jgi:hypothetical protein
VGLLWWEKEDSSRPHKHGSQTSRTNCFVFSLAVPRALVRSKNWLCSATRPPLRRKWLCFVSRSTVPRMALFCRRPPRSQNWLCFTRRPRERCYSVDCTPSRTSPGRERASLSRKIEQHEEQLSQDQQSTGDGRRIWCARPSHLCFPLLVVPSAQDPLK